jgi:putative phage-type endonuclease
MSVEILHPTSRSEWLALRKKDVTASVAGALLGVHPYTTPYRMWAEKTGQLSDVETTRAMQRGTAFEPVAIELLRRKHPDWIVSYENDLTY